VARDKKGEKKLAQEKVEVPLTGKVTSVNVKAGDKVKEGDVVCIIEAMKMENPILTPVGGKVTKVDISAGQLVNAGDLVAVIEY
jgi:biotin carboxyl carrier protein